MRCTKHSILLISGYLRISDWIFKLALTCSRLRKWLEYSALTQNEDYLNMSVWQVGYDEAVSLAKSKQQ